MNNTTPTTDTRPDHVIAAETLAALFASLGLRTEITGAHAAIDRTPGESGKVHEWAHVAVLVTFTSKDGKQVAAYPWKMGTGLVDWKAIARRNTGHSDDYMAEKMAQHGANLTALAQVATCDHYLGAFVKAVKPAEVLARVCADGREAGETTFEDWCANCGSDPDSRSAEATYLLCQKHGTEARRLVGGEAFVKLADLANQL